MSDESKQPEEETRRRVTADPRLQREGGQASALAQAAMISGWTAALVAVVFLFWLSITKKFGVGPKVILAVAVVLTIFWAKVYWDSLKETAAARGVRLGTSSALFALFVLGILVLVNFIGARHHWRHDLTQSKLFSLSDQTRQVVKALKQEVGMIAFVSPDYFNGPEIRDRLREYEMLGPKLKVEVYDPKTNRQKVEEHNVSFDGTIIVKSGEREEKVTGGDEEQLTSAILAVTSGEKTKVYFLTGHGERSYEGTDRRAIRTIKATLENQQYELETLNLATEKEPKVPKDCAVLVIAGPTEPVRDKEMAAVTSYANQAGKLLVALEPRGPDLSELLEPHGVQPLAGMVIDPARGWFGAIDIPLAMEMGKHEITDPLQGRAVALPTARAFEILETEEPEEPMYPGAPPPPPETGIALLETSGEAWLETTASGTVQKDPGERGGPLVMAVAVDEGQQEPPPYPGMDMPEPDENALRMVVLGDADLMTDEIINLGLQGNAYFVLNSVNWLLENEKLISIPPKDDLPKYLTMNDRQMKLVGAFAAIIVPLLVIISGVVVWWRRR